MARCVWALTDEDLTETIISSREKDAKLWMLWLVDTLPSADLTRVLVTMWAIWCARRRAIHDDQYQSPLSTHTFVEKFLAELEMMPDKKTRPKDLHVTSGDLHVIFGDLHATRSGQRVSPSHVWLPPEHHDVKINVDAGFSKVSDRAATTVVCRDKRGNYLGASAIIYDGRLDPTILEAQACCEALSLASDL